MSFKISPRRNMTQAGAEQIEQALGCHAFTYVRGVEYSCFTIGSAHTHAHAHTQSLSAFSLSLYIHIEFVYIYMSTYVRAVVYSYIYTLYVKTYLRIHRHKNIYIYIYIYIYMYVYVYIYIYVHRARGTYAHIYNANMRSLFPSVCIIYTYFRSYIHLQNSRRHKLGSESAQKRAIFERGAPKGGAYESHYKWPAS